MDQCNDKILDEEISTIISGTYAYIAFQVNLIKFTILSNDAIDYLSWNVTWYFKNTNTD